MAEDLNRGQAASILLTECGHERRFNLHFSKCQIALQPGAFKRLSPIYLTTSGLNHFDHSGLLAWHAYGLGTFHMKNYKNLSVAIVLALVGAGNAFAVSIGDTGSAINDIGSHQSGSGGEFRYRATSGTVNNGGYVSGLTSDLGTIGSFQTFCLERTENLGGSVTYVVNDEAVMGGNNLNGSAGNNGGDILSRGTAWLYSLFAQGLLGSYNYGAGRTTSAGLLQDAIWALEDELSNPGANVFYTMAVAQFGSIALAEVNYTPGEFGVYALNNTSSNGQAKQDMLYFDGPGQLVPDAGTSLVLLGLALSGMSLLPRWRLFKRDERQ